MNLPITAPTSSIHPDLYAAATSQPDKADQPGLSPLARYHLRKLLAHYQQATANKPPTSPLSLPEVLPTRQAFASDVKQLETLVLMHQKLSETSDHATLQCLEQKIVNLLRLNPATKQITAKILADSSVYHFCFFHANAVRQGIFHEGQHYGLIDTLAIPDRLVAYQLVWFLGLLEIPAILTTGHADGLYGLWIAIKSPSYPVFLKHGKDIVLRMRSLYLPLLRFRNHFGRKLQPRTSFSPVSRAS